MPRSPAKSPKRKRPVAAASGPAVVSVTESTVEAVPAAAPQVHQVIDTPAGPAVALAAHCSIKEVADLHARLSALADESAPVVIDAGVVERIDTAALQLLYAFVRHRLAGDREVAWRNVSTSLTDAAQLLGMRDLLCLPAAH